ncbi:MAG: TonB-dependent receptor [Bacteroidales bacterium]|nr:TonB-dependent receptor [Bacteroidales bacterium]
MSIKYFVILIVSIISYFPLQAQFLYQGIIKDKRSGEALVGANVIISNTQQILHSNNYGFFAINHTLPQIIVTVQFVGYKSQILELHASTTTQTIEMEPDTIHISEVNISSENNLTNKGFIQLTSKNFNTLPVILGEKDLLKSIQTQSGVIQNAEGTTNFSFRGSNAGENLFLIDGIPVYNINHLYGFVSIFNTDAINVANFYKNGIPARFGGRNASVTDVIVKEGNMKKLTGNYSLGVLSSKILLEGPIKKDTASFLVAIRRSFYDLFVAPITYLNNKSLMGYFFFDITAKTNYSLNPNNKVYLSLYAGKDNSYLHENTPNFRSKYNNGWQNYTTSVRWNNSSIRNTFTNITLAFTRFHYNNSLWEKGITEQIFHKSEFRSGIYDYIVKWDGRYYRFAHHKINFGVEWYHHTFVPGIEKKQYSEANIKIVDRTTGLDLVGNEWNVYVDDDFNWNRLQLEAGLRFSIFNISRTNYKLLQPRISITYSVNPRFFINTSYHKMNQYMHLTANSTIGLPTELWLPISKKFPPLETQQYTIGLKHIRNPFNISWDIFYKTLNNTIDVKEGYTFYNEHLLWDEILTKGKGFAYGFDITINHNIGVVHSIFSYTFCRSYRKYDEINQGKWYNFQYDRPHNTHLLINYYFKPNKILNVSWTFSSGALTTIPVQTYFVFKRPVMDLSQKNNYRLPSFHHLDISYQTSKNTKRGIRTWNLGIYNAYARNNPFLIRYKTTDREGRLIQNPTLEGIGIFPLVPFIAYEFKFY